MKELGLAVILLRFSNTIFWSIAPENNTNLTIGRTSFFISEGSSTRLSGITASDATNTSSKVMSQLADIWGETAGLSAMRGVGNWVDESIMLSGQLLEVNNSLTKTDLGFGNIAEATPDVIIGMKRNNYLDGLRDYQENHASWRLKGF